MKFAATAVFGLMAIALLLPAPSPPAEGAKVGSTNLRSTAVAAQAPAVAGQFRRQRVLVPDSALDTALIAALLRQPFRPY